MASSPCHRLGREDLHFFVYLAGRRVWRNPAFRRVSSVVFVSPLGRGTLRSMHSSLVKLVNPLLLALQKAKFLLRVPSVLYALDFVSCACSKLAPRSGLFACGLRLVFRSQESCVCSGFVFCKAALVDNFALFFAHKRGRQSSLERGVVRGGAGVDGGRSVAWAWCIRACQFFAVPGFGVE